MRILTRIRPTDTDAPTRLASIGVVALIGFANFYAAPIILSGGDLALDPSQGGGGGSASAQVIFIAIFAASIGAAFVADQWSILTRPPRFLLATLAWCWLSSLWATDPTASFRRLMFTSIVILTAVYLVELLPHERLMRVLTATLAIVVIADWLAVLLLPAATRDLLDPLASDGGWRGLHLEKNEAGAVLANCFIFFIHETVRKKSRLTGPFLCIASAILLIQTHSKTSIGFVGVAILLGAICAFAYVNLAARYTTLLTFVAFILVSIGTSELLGPQLELILDDPSAFTGRSQIWAALIDYAHDHLLFGAGYGSFWGVGAASPIMAYGGTWLTTVYEAHNGYLDLLVNIGLIGLVIAVYDLVIRPLWAVFTRPLVTGVSRSMLCALIAFACLHNLLESTFLGRASPAWVIAVLTYSILFKSVAATRQGPALPREEPGLSSLSPEDGIAR